MNLQDQMGIDEIINEAFQPISSFWEGLILHEFFGTGIPTIIFLLVGGAIFFTFYFNFISLKGFKHTFMTTLKDISKTFYDGVPIKMDRIKLYGAIPMVKSLEDKYPMKELYLFN